jgi:hypothetical protein
MSKKRKHGRTGNTATPFARKRGSSAELVIVLAVVIAAFVFWWWNSEHPRGTASVSATETRTTNPTPAMAIAKPEFQKLTGKWLRPDGGYVIEIKSVDGSGKLDAAYFNPRPIHVARAEASTDGAAIKVFIELRDVNYPGSTYTLAYDAERDQLKGIYFQAMLQKQYEVVFVRTP